MPGRSNNCSSFEITARLPIQLQRELDLWSASATGTDLAAALCLQHNGTIDKIQATGLWPVMSLVVESYEDGPQGRGYKAHI